VPAFFGFCASLAVGCDSLPIGDQRRSPLAIGFGNR
jgi:hypothetical protein